jgi:CheY-like chemotaxis protein
LQRLLGRYLDGAEIVPTRSWEEALQELSESPSQALLVNDMSLGSAFQRLRATTLPYDALGMVCFVPGPDQPAGALGVSSYLVKPISRDTLLAALDYLELDNKTILIVDDEPEALRLFRRMLDSSRQGYRVLRARDGLEAMDLAREHRPDAILLDLAMPNMDGFEFLEAKSQDSALKDIPVLVITARDPTGQPIVSNALTVTRGDGLSVHQLLTCIKTICEVLSPIDRSAAPMPTAVPPG